MIIHFNIILSAFCNWFRQLGWNYIPDKLAFPAVLSEALSVIQWGLLFYHLWMRHFLYHLMQYRLKKNCLYFIQNKLHSFYAFSVFMFLLMVFYKCLEADGHFMFKMNSTFIFLMTVIVLSVLINHKHWHTIVLS